MLLRTLPLLQNEFEHRIIALKELGELAPQFTKKGIPVTVIHLGLFNIRSYRKLLSEIKQFNPDVIITYLFHADMIGRLFLKSHTSSPKMKRNNPVPIIPFLRTTYNHPKYLIARTLEWLTKRLVRHYLANSEAVKKFYISNIGIQKEKITVLPNGIDFSTYKNVVESNAIHALKFPKDRFIITCVANFAKNKGHSTLLEAFESFFAQVADESRMPFLLLVGDGPERKNLKSQIKNYQSKNHIFFLGRRTDIPSILQGSDCFILPTLFEGMSNAIMEAMAIGLPIITTDIPENRELIKNSFSGILIPVKNAPLCRKALYKLYNDSQLRIKLGNNAKTTIKELYTLEIISSHWRSFLHSL